MTFIGFVAFLDPPKKEVKSTIKKLKEYGIDINDYNIFKTNLPSNINELKLSLISSMSHFNII